MDRKYTQISCSDVLSNTWIFHDTHQEKRFVDSCLRKIRDKNNGQALFTKLFMSLSPEREIKIKVVKDVPTSSEPYVHSRVLERYKIRDIKTSLSYKSLLNMNANISKPSHLMYSKRQNTGMGVCTEILFNPNESRIVDEYGIGERRMNHDLAFVSLAHELVLALYSARGERFPENEKNPYSDPNEDRAIGIIDYWDERVSENGVRHDHNLPLRTTRYDRNDVQDLAEKHLTQV